MDIAEEHMTMMVKKGEKENTVQAGLSGPKLGWIICPWRIFLKSCPNMSNA
jgi:hypothetical protein